MALTREQIAHLEHGFIGHDGKPWRKLSHSRKWLKKQMNKYMRLKGKKISEDDAGGKVGKKPMYGWEY